MAKLNIKHKIIIVIILDFLLIGSVGNTYIVWCQELSERKIEPLQRVDSDLTHSINELQWSSKQNELNHKILTSGTITEDSDDFLAGTLENVTLTSNGFLRLDRETTSRLWTYADGAWSFGGLERFGHAMIYDSTSAKFILFGGMHYGTYLSDTWTYDLGRNNWTEMTPSPSPNARMYHSMVYNSNFDKVILFGGYSGSYLSDTWVYHLETNTWTNMNPVNPPNGRTEHFMVYDSNLDKVILFGGYNGSSPLNDTWVYDLDTNTWTEMECSLSPSARTGHSMVYHSYECKAVLFGGDDANPGFLDDTWVYDLEANIWIQKNTLNSPYPRKYHAMVYEVHSSKVILFGGTDSSERSTTWSYDLNTNIWTLLKEIIEEGEMSLENWWWYSQTLAYDSYLEKVVYFGGFNPTNNAISEVTFILDRNYHQKGIFTSRMFSFDNIYNISGKSMWNPMIQPRDLELNVQIGFSNTTKEEDFQYTGYSSSGFVFKGLAQHIRYRVLFNSSEREYWTTIGWFSFREFSPILTKINIEYILEKPQPVIQISNPGNLSVVEGMITVSAIVSSPNGIDKVYFYIGGLLHTIDYSPPFIYTWNSTTSENGYVTLLVAAVSILGRENSESIQVLVDNPVVIVPIISEPSAPQGLSTLTGDNFVTISWTVPADDGGSAITSYRVYRGTTTGEYMFVGITTTTSYNDTVVIGDITYFYVVTAINAIGESTFSTEVSATPTGMTIPKSGTFPSFVILLIFLGTLVVVTRKFKKI